MRFTPHTSQFEADFGHASALTGLTEVSFREYMLDCFSQGRTRRAARLLAVWKD